MWEWLFVMMHGNINYDGKLKWPFLECRSSIREETIKGHFKEDSPLNGNVNVSREWLGVRELSKEWEMIHSLPKATTNPTEDYQYHMILNDCLNFLLDHFILRHMYHTLAYLLYSCAAFVHL